MAVGRALAVNASRGEIAQGASTLTQQLVKNLVLGPERTWSRKIREGALALAVERRHPKERSSRPTSTPSTSASTGGRRSTASGPPPRATSARTRGVSALAESALLAGMIRAPNRYSPAEHAERARGRRDFVLRQMHELGMIDGRSSTRRWPSATRCAARRACRRRPRTSSTTCARRPGADLRAGQPADLHDARPDSPAGGRGGRGPGAGPPGERAPPPAPLAVRGAAPGRAGGPRSRDGRRPRHGGRAGLRAVRVQPRDPRPPAARLRVQALRVPGGAPARPRRASRRR